METETEQKKSQIHVMDHTGHSTIAEFDATSKYEVEVAQSKLTKFLEKCVKTHGATPPVWAKRFGEQEFTQLDEPKASNLKDVEEVVLQFPLVGG